MLSGREEIVDKRRREGGVSVLEEIFGLLENGGRRRLERRPVEVGFCVTGSSGIGREGDEPVGQALGGFEEGPGISAGMAADLPLKKN